MVKRSLLLLLFLLSLLVPARAEAAGGLRITPAVQEVTLAEGQTEATFEIALTNNDTQSSSIRLKAYDFKALDESGGVAFVGGGGEGETSYRLTSWLSFNKDVVTLDPGETETLTVTVSNRESLSPGGHYGAVVMTPSDAETPEIDNKVDILPSSATLVLVRKSGGERQDLDLDSIRARSGLFQPVKDVVLRFQNKGNVHVVPRGLVRLSDPFGDEVGLATVNPSSSYILPDSFRQFPVQFRSPIRLFWPGRYTLTAEWRIDGDDNAEITTQTFWYVGWWPLVVLIFPLLWITLVLLHRKRNKTP